MTQVFIGKGTIAFLFIVSHVVAGTLVPPADLNVGDQYRLVFVTSESTTGLSSDIDTYNEFVQRAADNSQLDALNLEWRAIVSTPDVDAITNTKTQPGVDELVPIYRVDGTKFLLVMDELWVHNSITPVKFTEHGVVLPSTIDAGRLFKGRPVFTGTNHLGRGVPGAELGQEFVSVGDSGAWMTRAITRGGSASHTEAHIYGISGIITYVPEPSMGVYAIGILVFTGALRRGLSVIRTQSGHMVC